MRPLRVAFLVVDNRESGDPVFGVTSPHFGTAPNALLEGLSLQPEKVEIHVLSCVTRRSPSPEKLAENIHFEQIVLPKWSFLRSFHAGPILAIRKRLATLQPDIVHAHGVERWCAVSGALSGFPSVLTIHGYLPLINRAAPMKPRLYWKVQEFLGEIALPRFDGVICISKHIQDAVRRKAKRTWQIPNAVLAEFFQPAREPKSPVPTLLVVGTITENKQPLEILRAMEKLPHRGRAFKVKFIGDLSGELAYQNEFLSLLAKNPFASYAPRLSTNAIIEQMDASHALIHFPMEEAFGLVVAEALARGLKVFASRIGGIQDIADGVSGVELFDSNDWTSLVEALQLWLDCSAPGLDPAPDIMKKRYSPADVAKQHCLVYESVVNRPSR